MTIGVAQLGTWHVHAAHHVKAARSNAATNAAVVWDSRPGAARSFGEQHGLPSQEDLTAVLARDDVQAVVVDTATTEHFPVISAALRAGKHVFSEKVLAPTTREVDALIALADEHALVLGVSLQRLIEAPVRTVKRLIDEGRLGRVTGSRIRYAHHGAVGTPWIPEHFFSLAETGAAP
ncbi:Gfo/Idh/MocA family protein [Naasia aerilata]|uniref:Gfo/Idh/MocA-like oxidoreductase N-terminal domain-containing protein n=1 Tax=Naasia aerilata TaxID=1162966 RepID=A0ABM8GD30_9MICO|nr:Gfo/Idh/MocA family oxidoreductase [Naasia aerilata]BDZ46177.1 hypothetical protein GCM10025866_20860 [Naasia aerilata]